MKVLSIAETGYRATVEEQDDTILWLNGMFAAAGLDVTLLLRANAVNYTVKGQDASGLSFGGVAMSHAPKLDEDVSDLAANGVPVYYVSEDAADRGISVTEMIDGVEPVNRSDLPAFVDGFDQIWHW
jgi:hypothetical protein